MERFHTEDRREFRTVRELRDILDEWLTAPGAFVDLQYGYVESSPSEHFSYAVLFSERLTDGSYVFGIRLS